MQIRIETNDAVHALEQSGTLAVPVGDAVTFAGPGASAAPVDSADGFEIDEDYENRVTFDRPGRYPIRVTAGFDGALLTVVAYDGALLDRVKTKNGTDADRRRVMSELARYELGFDGTWETFRRFNLRNYGAS